MKIDENQRRRRKGEGEGEEEEEEGEGVEEEVEDEALQYYIAQLPIDRPRGCYVNRYHYYNHKSADPAQRRGVFESGT